MSTITVTNLQGHSSGAAANEIRLASTQTLDVNGTLDVTGATFTGAGVINTANIADDAITAAKIADAVDLGKIIQVKQGVRTASGNYDTGTSSFLDVGLEVDISPSATTNDILLLCSINGIYHAVGGDSGYHHVRLAKEISSTTTAVANQNTNFHAEIGRGQSQGEHDNVSLMIVDEPATTSTITYKLQAKQGSGSNNFFYNDTASTSTLIAIEIKGGLS